MKRFVLSVMFLVILLGLMYATSSANSQIAATPNPFDVRTTITCNVEANQFVTIQINESNGLFIKNLYMGKSDGNPIIVTWDGTDAQGNTLSTGKYECELKYEDVKFTSVKKILVFK